MYVCTYDSCYELIGLVRCMYVVCTYMYTNTPTPHTTHVGATYVRTLLLPAALVDWWLVEVDGRDQLRATLWMLLMGGGA